MFTSIVFPLGLSAWCYCHSASDQLAVNPFAEMPAEWLGSCDFFPAGDRQSFFSPSTEIGGEGRVSGRDLVRVLVTWKKLHADRLWES